MIGGFKLPLYDNLVSGILARLWGCDLRPLLWLKMESLTLKTKYISMLLHSFQWSLCQHINKTKDYLSSKSLLAWLTFTFL